jgi:putative DNA primase/helicase
MTEEMAPTGAGAILVYDTNSASQAKSAAPILVTFAGLRDMLNFRADDHIAIGHQHIGEPFGARVVAHADADAEVARHVRAGDVWFSVNPTNQRVGSTARGTAAQVTRPTSMWADLDVKPGGFATYDDAWACINEISGLLGTRPSAVVSTGHGLQPYWPIDPESAAGLDNPSAAALARAFGRLVAIVASHYHAGVDNVFDLSRVLRVPGTVNWKDSAHKPLVTMQLDNGGPLTIEELTERLREVGIDPDDEIDPVGAEVLSSPASWYYDQTIHCPYVPAMVEAWATDTPSARNPWMFSQQHRIAAAHRLGCFSDQAAHHNALASLEKRHRWLLANQPPVRPLKKYELNGARSRAIDKVSLMSDDQAQAELGNHHPHWDEVMANSVKSTEGSQPSPDSEEKQQESSPRSKFIGRDGLRVFDLAHAVMQSVACGFSDIDSQFHVYNNGVWTPGVDRIEGEIVKLLGNRYRNAHTRNVLDVIRHQPETVRITRDPLPEFINVPNGMVRWNDSVLLTHSPAYRSTVQLPIEYDPDATCPKFDKFLADVLPLDCYEPCDGGPGFIWELIGYALYSGNPLHIAVLFFGKGRNGKGTLLRIMKAVIGARNTSAVGLHELTENRFRAATLFGKTANLAGDLDSRWIDNTAAFKSITGGDTIQGEHKYGAVFDFTPWALPIYSANKPFGSADSSEGWKARWVVVPFPTMFPGDDPGLDARLQTGPELRGILRRGIEALPALMQRGRLPRPASVANAKEYFIAASDVVRAWVDEACEFDPDAWTPRQDLYSKYSQHTVFDGSKRLSAAAFYNRLEQIRGVTPHKSVGVRGFRGIRFRISGALGAGLPADSHSLSRAHTGERVENLPQLPQAVLSPGWSDVAYRGGLCRDCGARPYSAGRPRCDECHAAWTCMPQQTANEIASEIER